MGDDQRRAFLAVLISGVILFGWSYFYGDKTSKPNTAKVETVKDSMKDPESLDSTSPDNSDAQEKIARMKEVEEVKIEKLLLRNGANEFVFDNHLGIEEFKSVYSDQELSRITGDEKNFAIMVKEGEAFKPLTFYLANESESIAYGTDSTGEHDLRIQLLETGKIYLQVKSKNPTKYRLVFYSKERESEGGGGFLGSSTSQNDIQKYVLLSQDLESINIGSDGVGEFGAKWFGVDSSYHLFAFVFPEEKSIRYAVKENGPLSVTLNQESTKVEGYFVFSKKYYNNLKDLGDRLHMSLDYGIFSIIAVPLFRGLKFVHDIIPNWGIAIILVTLLIRLVTFPLYYKQMKSMNKMKLIQPEMAKIKEKFKDDPKRQQKETMELFKRTGVNPVGGCLPLILQMPIFIAFYSVLTVSAELDQEAFFGWITNLTTKDPYYVLPILVAGAMFLNQKLMPQTSTDPTQQKIMTFMPLIFAVIFINMPAGLNLYIFVSTLFGIGQQMVVNKRLV